MATVALSPNGVDEFHLDTRPDTVLAATMDGVVSCASRAAPCDGGAFSAGRHASCLAIDRQSVRRSQETHGDGFYRRAAGGDWVRAGDGLSEPNIFSLAAIATGELPVLYAGPSPPISSAAPTAAADGTNSKRFAAFRGARRGISGAAAHRPREAYRRRPARAAHDLRFNRTGSAASQRR